MKHFSKIFLRIDKCPLCKSKKKKIFKKTYSNKYLELVANDLAIDENKLIEKLENFQCKRCKLIYKKYWFKKKYLDYFYKQIDPIHSKGWDANSKFFSKSFFLDNMNILLNKDLNDLDRNRYMRSVISILNSIKVNKNEQSSINNFIKQLKRSNTNFINKKKNSIAMKINKPKIFSRFSGFGNKQLFDHIKNVVGKIDNILEIGCPRWGFLNNNKIKVNSSSFLKKKTCGYWNKKCEMKGINCIKTLNKNVNIINKVNKKYDFTGIYLYLDHTLRPLNLIESLLKKSKSCGIILESGNDHLRKGIAIQHFTLWNNSSISFLANLCKKKIDKSFKLIEKTGNKFYLIY
jgi:hypothetical protein